MIKIIPTNQKEKEKYNRKMDTGHGQTIHRKKIQMTNEHASGKSKFK